MYFNKNVVINSTNRLLAIENGDYWSLVLLLWFENKCAKVLQIYSLLGKPHKELTVGEQL